MGSTRIKYLKEIAEEMATAESTEKQIALLTKGFELFSEETERLDSAYGDLRLQFRAVNQKLEDTNVRLANKVQELHVLTAYLDNILSHMSQGILFIDIEGNLTTYNQAAEAILEKPRNEILFQRFSDHFGDKVLGFSIQQALEEKKPPKISYVSIEFPEGKKKELEVESTFLSQKPDSPQNLDFTQGLIILIRDITELRRLQISASRQDRLAALGEMAAQVAHEIRNPLGGIKGFASLLARDLKEEPEKKRLAEYIVEGSDTLDRLVAQVLNYSRPLSLDLKETDLKKMLEEWKEAFEADSHPEKEIKISLLAKETLSVPVDQGMLKLALNNLAANSVQAIEKKGFVKIDLKKNGEMAEIIVTDNGCGIPQEHLKKLFSPFFSTKANGNGLGLAEVHKVVQGHGGEISVTSEPGKGTQFILKLPIRG